MARKTYAYRLEVTYPEGSQEPDWEPSAWPEICKERGWYEEAYGASTWPDWPGWATWTKRKTYLSGSAAAKRKKLLERFGATVTMIRSLPIEWPAPEPVTLPDSCSSCGSEIRAEPGLVPGRTGMPVTCGDEWHDEEG